MDLKSWLLEYGGICKELSILPKDDYGARDLAAELVADRRQDLPRIKSLVYKRAVAIFGAGPSLPRSLSTFQKDDKTIISCDGATSALLEAGVFPDIVVTDLDGDINDILLADRFGAIIVAHAHADNIGIFSKTVPLIKNLIATTQVEPLENIYNFFGFTDGDRAVFLADYFGASEIELIGFDFGDIVGAYSDPKNPTDHAADSRKKKKLEIAERLIAQVFFKKEKKKK